MTCRSFALVGVLFAAVPVLAADAPLPKVPDDFRCEIVLQAPDIEAPTALCVAFNGDVYFAEDPMDMGGPPTKNIDKIWLLKGGDPKKKILFADKMWAVMGLEIVGDKLYCVHAPHVTVFTLDEEGKAKSREDLFTDLGPPVAGVPSFNDHIPSGIRMGMDGWLYVSIGDKGIPKMTRKEKDGGSVHVAEGRWRYTKEGNFISLEGGGVIRFRPDGSGLEVFACGTRNHLDVPLDEHDRIFVRDNTDDGQGWNTRLMYLPRHGFLGYPWAYKYGTQDMLPMIHDFGGGAPCGGYVYNDDGLPDKYKGRIFHCEWGQGKVWAVKVVPDGAGFKYVDQIAFMDPTGTGVQDFRPFTLRPTADGRGFYVTDWGYGGWLQNMKRGRIFKVTYGKDDVKPVPRGKDTDSVEELVKSLDHPALSERLRAQRALSARGQPAFDAAKEALKHKETSKRAIQHLLWVYRDTAGKNALAESWLPNLLGQGSRDADVRLELVRVLSTFTDQDFPRGRDKVDPRQFFQNWLRTEKDAQVRLALVTQFSRKILFILDGKEFLAYLDTEEDPIVRHVAINTLKEAAGRGAADPELNLTWNWRTLDGQFDEIAPKFKSDSQVLLQVLLEEYDPAAVRIAERYLKVDNADLRKQALDVLAHAYKQRKPYTGGWWGTQPAGHREPPREVEWDGTAQVRAAILTALGDKNSGVRQAAIAALIAARDPKTLDPLKKQFEMEKDAAAQADIVRAVAGLQAKASVEFLSLLLIDPDRPEPVRLAALEGLEKINTPEAGAAIVGCLCSKASAAFEVRVLQALATAKPEGAWRVAGNALTSERVPVRQAAATALGKIGGESADKLLLPLLTDTEPTVQMATIQALGTLKAKDAIPALILASHNEATQFDAITALSLMPDKRALSAYLTGLGSKNAALRQSCAAAISSIRDEVMPTLEQLVKGNELPANVLPELRTIYLSFSPILNWKLIGPFPEDGKAHPPQTEQKFDAVYEGADKKQVRWLDKKGDAAQHGRVNLLALFSPNTNVAAYGYAEIEADQPRDAQLLVGSDDTITIWLNGKKVHEFLGNRGWTHDQDRVNVKLDKGTNKLLIKCGNASGPWEFSVAVTADSAKYAFLKGGPQKFDLETFRAFARKTPGDAERGKKLFMDVKGLACIKCHAVAGEGGKVGPDLAGIAIKYKKEDLMTSVLEPSKVIAQGYETIVVTNTKGKTLTGVFKGETTDAVSLIDAEGKLHTIPKKEIDERGFSPVSTMPNGLNDGMTLQDFADVIAFLEARREEKVTPKKEN